MFRNTVALSKDFIRTLEGLHKDSMVSVVLIAVFDFTADQGRRDSHL